MPKRVHACHEKGRYKGLSFQKGKGKGSGRASFKEKRGGLKKGGQYDVGRERDGTKKK